MAGSASLNLTFFLFLLSYSDALQIGKSLVLHYGELPPNHEKGRAITCMEGCNVFAVARKDTPQEYLRNVFVRQQPEKTTIATLADLVGAKYTTASSGHKTPLSFIANVTYGVFNLNPNDSPTYPFYFYIPRVVLDVSNVYDAVNLRKITVSDAKSVTILNAEQCLTLRNFELGYSPNATVCISGPDCPQDLYTTERGNLFAKLLSPLVSVILPQKASFSFEATVMEGLAANFTVGESLIATSPGFTGRQGDVVAHPLQGSDYDITFTNADGRELMIGIGLDSFDFQGTNANGMAQILDGSSTSVEFKLYGVSFTSTSGRGTGARLRWSKAANAGASASVYWTTKNSASSTSIYAATFGVIFARLFYAS